MFCNIFYGFPFLFICFIFCLFRAFVLFCVLILLLYIAVSFLFLYKFTNQDRRVEIQLQ